MSNDENANDVGIDNIDPDEFSVTERDEELDAAKEEAEKEAENSISTYTHKFKKPLEYMNVTYTELSFDWDSLDGEDCLNIEAEMQALGKTVIAEEFNSDYMIRYAAKACTTKISSDIFKKMRAKDFKTIKGKVRSFLLLAE